VFIIVVAYIVINSVRKLLDTPSWFLAQKTITKMEHPPYSPDLAPNDF